MIEDTSQEMDQEKIGDKILNAKLNCTTKELLENIPVQMQDYMIYIWSLKFEENPDYEYLKRLFLDFLKGSQSESEKPSEEAESKHNSSTVIK